MKDNYNPPDDKPGAPYPHEEELKRAGGTPSQYAPSGRAAVRTPEVTPRVTYVILGITVFMFILQFASISQIGYDVPANNLAKINQAIIQGQIWRLITPVLLHGSILHLGFNMYALFVLGPGLERYYGHWRFLTLYLVAGFAGNVMSFLFTPAPSLGASTAIFGLLGAQGVFLYQNREIFGRPVQRALMNLVVIAAINLMFGLSPGIDNWGHIGGLIGGTLFAWYAGPVLAVRGIYPNLSIEDQRSSGDVIRTTISVTALFSALTLVTIYLRK